MKKIQLMHYLFGENDEKCKTCNHLVRRQANRVYYKCECYSLSRSSATDWRVNDTACGLYNKPWNGTQVIRLANIRDKIDNQIKGQISLLGDV